MASGMTRVSSLVFSWLTQGIRRRIGASGAGLDGPFPPKPPNMRWATYERLRAIDAALQEQWLFGAARDLGRLHSRVKRRRLGRHHQGDETRCGGGPGP